MSDPRTVYRRAALILLASLALVPGGSVSAADGLRFIEPADGSLVAGPTRFRFAVPAGGPAIDRIDVYVDARLIGVALPPEWMLDWQEERTLRGETVTAVAYAAGTIVGRAGIRSMSVGGMQHVQVELVQLYPVVRDSQGRFVRGLTRDDFAVYENGREVPIKHLESEVNSLNIALLLDVSRSMQGKLAPLQEASIDFAGQLGTNDALALYAFNHRVHRLLPLTRERGAVRERIRDLRASGGTALYDGLVEVVRDFADVPGRKAVVVFSDGQDKLSLSSLPRVAREATAAEVIVYALGAGHDAGTARDDLAELATRSGGGYYFIERPRELAEVYRQIRLHLKAQYLLSYEPPAGPEELRRIEVRVRGRGYDVSCRTGYHFIPGN